MTILPPDPGDDTRHRLDALAEVVRSELAAAGLPVIPQDHPLGTSGATAEVDKLEWRGVLVHWHAHPILMHAGRAAWADDPMREGEETKAFNALIEGTAEAMGNAIHQILTLAGLEVRTTGNDYAPHERLVTRRLRPSPWRARHDALFTRQYETMQEGWRRHHEQERAGDGTAPRRPRAGPWRGGVASGPRSPASHGPPTSPWPPARVVHRTWVTRGDLQLVDHLLGVVARDGEPDPDTAR